MRPLVLVLALLALSSSAFAQDANETNATNETNGSVPGNESAPEGNATEPPAEEEPAGPLTIVLEGVQEGSAYYFRDESGARNPTINVKPGQQVIFKFTSVSGVHNLNVAGAARTELMSDGETAPDLVWTAPAEPTRLEYWCDPHKGAGMKGAIVVGETPAPGNGAAEEGEISGAAIDLGSYTPEQLMSLGVANDRAEAEAILANCQGRRAPALVTEGVTGGPTLADYFERCRPETETTEVAKQPADYVIPVSWLLIGLGIVGVVWVHKYYKP